MIDARKTLSPYLACAALLCSLPITWTSQYAWVGPLLSGLILVFGLPHGAYDIFLLRARFGRQRVLRAASAYLLAALCVPLIWWVSPTAFLLLFLGLSIVHFGDSDWPEETWLAKLGWGILVLAIPVTVQPGEVSALFAVFAPASLSVQVVQTLTMLLVPAGFTLLTQRKTFGLKLLALLLLAALCLRTSALVGFAVYFCLFHSRSHLVRWRLRVPVRETRMAGMLVVGVLLGVAALVFSNSAAEPLGAFDVRVVAITFLVLASLTVPHMITVALMLMASSAFADGHGKSPTIVEVASSNADFSTLVTALKAADLVDTLNGTDPLPCLRQLMRRLRRYPKVLWKACSQIPSSWRLF